MFENRSLRIQMVNENKPNTELRPYNIRPVDHDLIVKQVTGSVIKIVVVYISADTLRKVIVAAAKAKL